MSRGPEPAGRSGIGSSNSRFQQRSVTGLDRLAQPLHREFDALRLQMAPALDFGLVPLLWKALEIFRGQLPGGRALPGEFLADERVLGHDTIKARFSAGNRPMALKETAPARGSAEAVLTAPGGGPGLV